MKVKMYLDVYQNNVQDHCFFFSIKTFFVMFLWATVFANNKMRGLVYCVNVSLDHSQLNVHV